MFHLILIITGVWGDVMAKGLITTDILGGVTEGDWHCVSASSIWSSHSHFDYSAIMRHLCASMWTAIRPSLMER